MAKKPKTISKEVEAAAVLLQLYVRLKASDEHGYCKCVTCGAVKYYKDGMQGGHFISRKWLATKLLEENVHPQCAACNAKHIGNGMPVEYTLYMIETYGREFVDELIEMKKPHKFYKAEVKEIKADLREKIKLLEKDIS